MSAEVLGWRARGSSLRWQVWRLAAEHSLCVVVPIWFTAYMCVVAATHHAFAIDFHNAFWPAGHRILDGASPYSAPRSLAALNGMAFVYPAVGALFFAGWALIPHGAADVLFVLVSICGLLATLRLLGVRDWRVYGLTMLWPPVVSGWQTANVTLLLVLGVAVLWRVRNRPAAAGALVAVLLSVKLFLWPLGLWLLVTRRFAATAWMVASALVLNLLAWGMLGIHQIHAYLTLIKAVTRVEERTGYTVISLALHLGCSRGVAYAGSMALAGAASWGMVRAARRQDDLAVLLLALTVSLLLTPTVWRHYFALLLVPMAIARPRLDWLWTVPLLLFLCPVTTPALWQLLLALGSVGVVVIRLQSGARAVGDPPPAAHGSLRLPLTLLHSSGGRTR